MNLSRAFQRVLRKHDEVGTRQTLIWIWSQAVRRPLRRLRDGVRASLSRWDDGWLDRRHGLQTRRTETDEAFEDTPDRFGYDPTPRVVFRRALKALRIAYPEFLFLDVGSGKGRILLLASHFPFQEILGLEIDPSLNAIALENIRRYQSRAQKCLRIRSVCEDALAFPLPPQKTVLFIFNPFGRDKLHRYLQGIEASQSADPRDLFLVYVCPDYREVFDASGWLTLINEAEGHDPYTGYCIYSNRGAAGTR